MPVYAHLTFRIHHTPAYPSLLARWTTFVLIGFLLLTAQGCTDLKAIQDFAALSADSAEYTTLVNDYIESPQRQKRYQPESRHTKLEQMVQERADQKSTLLIRHAVIEQYMATLGALAADEVVDNTA